MYAPECIRAPPPSWPVPVLEGSTDRHIAPSHHKSDDHAVSPSCLDHVFVMSSCRCIMPRREPDQTDVPLMIVPAGPTMSRRSRGASLASRCLGHRHVRPPTSGEAQRHTTLHPTDVSRFVVRNDNRVLGVLCQHDSITYTEKRRWNRNVRDRGSQCSHEIVAVATDVHRSDRPRGLAIGTSLEWRLADASIVAAASAVHPLPAHQLLSITSSAPLTASSDGQ
jgi:hypothetical protein